jgi:hypothetical protein
LARDDGVEGGEDKCPDAESRDAGICAFSAVDEVVYRDGS